MSVKDIVQAVLSDDSARDKFKVRRIESVRLTVAQIIEVVNCNLDHPLALKFRRAMEDLPLEHTVTVDKATILAVAQNRQIEVDHSKVRGVRSEFHRLGNLRSDVPQPTGEADDSATQENVMKTPSAATGTDPWAVATSEQALASTQFLVSNFKNMPTKLGSLAKCAATDLLFGAQLVPDAGGPGPIMRSSPCTEQHLRDKIAAYKAALAPKAAGTGLLTPFLMLLFQAGLAWAEEELKKLLGG